MAVQGRFVALEASRQLAKGMGGGALPEAVFIQHLPTL
jgi:hypothetical protein